MANISVEKTNPEVKIWEDRIERGKKLRKKKLKEVKVYIDFYKSLQWGNRIVNLQHKPTINLIFPHIRSQIPFLYFQNPKWFIRPTKYIEGTDTIANSKKLQDYLNYYAKENMGSSLKKQMRLAILDAFFLFGALKSGYVADFEANPNFGKHKILGYDADVPIYDVDVKNGEFKIDDVKEYPTNEKFVSRRVSPSAFIFDTEGNNYFDNGRYIIEEIVKSLDEVKKDDKYSNTDKLKENFSVKLGFGSRDDIESEDWLGSVEDDLKRITLYEIYDTEHDKLKVIAEGHNDFLRDEKTPDGVDKHPYSFLQFYTVPDEIYPISELRPLIPINEEYNIGRGMIMEHAKRFNRKYATVDGMIDDSELTKLENGGDGTIFKVKDLPLSKVIEPLQDAPLDSAVYSNFEQSKMDFREVGGATEQERGVVERRKTAYEASKMSEASGIRKEDRKSLVEDFAADTGNKLIQSMQANLTNEDAMLIDGSDGKMKWETIAPEQIKGQYRVTVEVGSSAPKIPEYERAEISQLIQSLAGFPPEMIMEKVNLTGLLKALSRTFHTLDADEILNSEEVQKQKQAEIQKKQQIASLIEMRGQDKPVTETPKSGEK